MYVKMCVIFGDVTCQGSEDGDRTRIFVWYKFSDLDGCSLPSVKEGGQNVTQNLQGIGQGSPDILKLYQGKTDWHKPLRQIGDRVFVLISGRWRNRINYEFMVCFEPEIMTLYLVTCGLIYFWLKISWNFMVFSFKTPFYHDSVTVSRNCFNCGQNNEILDFKEWNFVKFLIQIFKYLYRCFNRVRPRGGAPEFFGGATWPDRAFLSSDLKKLKLNKIDHQRKEPKRRIQIYDSLLTP